MEERATGLARPDALPTARTLSELEADILARKRLIGANIVAIGQALIEAKAQLSHGEWGAWLRDRVEFSQSSANNFMAIAREISQDSPLAQLPYTKVLALLAVPEGEREQFAEEIGAEDKSAAEIRRLIAERDEARKAEERALATNQLQAEKLTEQRHKLEQQERETDSLVRAREKEIESLKREIGRLQKQEPTVIHDEPEDYQDLKEAVERLAEEKARAEAEADRLADELDRQKLGEVRQESPAARILSAIGGFMAMCGRDPAQLMRDPSLLAPEDWHMVMDKTLVVRSWCDAMQAAWAKGEEACGA